MLIIKYFDIAAKEISRIHNKNKKEISLTVYVEKLLSRSDNSVLDLTIQQTPWGLTYLHVGNETLLNWIKHILMIPVISQ